MVYGGVVSTDPRPLFRDQSTLTGDRLGYPVMDGILSAYGAVYAPSAPIANLPMSGDGVVLRNQQLWAQALHAGTVTSWVQGQTVTISWPPGTTVPVTVPAGARPGSVSGPAFGRPYAANLAESPKLGSG